MEDNRIDNVYMSFFSNNFGLPLDVLDFRMFLRVKSDKKLKPERCYMCLKVIFISC